MIAVDYEQVAINQCDGAGSSNLFVATLKIGEQVRIVHLQCGQRARFVGTPPEIEGQAGETCHYKIEEEKIRTAKIERIHCRYSLCRTAEANFVIPSSSPVWNARADFEMG